MALGLQEFHQLDEQLRSETAVLEELRAGLEEQAKQAQAWEADTRRLEEILTCLEEASRAQETALAQARQQITAEETTAAHEWTLSADLEKNLTQMRAQRNELDERLAVLAEATARAADELGGAERLCQAQAQDVHLLEEQLHEAVRRIGELQSQVQADKVRHLEQMRQAAHLQNDAVSYKAQVDNLPPGT